MAGIVLPWPPASLSGHNTGNIYTKAAVIKQHRELAYEATVKAGVKVTRTGDIPVAVTFYPPDRRSDRINLWNRCKPLFDGIADALGVNDARFVPAGYVIAEPVKGGRVVVEIGECAAPVGEVVAGIIDEMEVQ